jgi:hypothetical protein
MQILRDRRQKDWDMKYTILSGKVGMSIAAKFQARAKREAQLIYFNNFSGYSNPWMYISNFKRSLRSSRNRRKRQRTGPPVSMRGGEAFDLVIARPNSCTGLSFSIESGTYVELATLRELTKASEPDYESIRQESWRHAVCRNRNRRRGFVRDWMRWEQAGEVVDVKE